MKSLTFLAVFIFLFSSISTIVFSQASFPTTFQNPSFEIVVPKNDIISCFGGLTGAGTSICANGTLDGANDVETRKINRPFSWITPSFDGVETRGVSFDGSRSVLIFTATNTTYDINGNELSQSFQCSYDSSNLPKTNICRSGANRTNVTLNGFINQTLRSTSDVITVSWKARVVDDPILRNNQFFFGTFPQPTVDFKRAFYGDDSTPNGLYRFRVVDYPTGNKVFSFDCGRRSSEPNITKLCDAGLGTFVENQITITNISVGQNLTFIWEANYPESNNDPTLTASNGVLIDDIRLVNTQIIRAELSPIELQINNVTSLVSILTSNNTVTTSGASGQLSARTLSRSEISRGFGDFYLFNITINDTRTAGNFIGTSVINIIRFLDSNDNAINVTNENLRINPSLVTAQTVSWNMYGYLPKQVEKIEVNLSYDTSATAVGRVTINQTFIYNPSVKSARNIFSNTIQNTDNELITGIYPIAFYNYNFDELTKNVTFSVVNFRRILGSTTTFFETETTNFFIFDQSGNLLDGSSVLRVYSSFINEDLTNFVSESIFGEVGNILLTNRTSTFPFSNAYSPLLTSSNRTVTTTSFTLIFEVPFCSTQCETIGGINTGKRFVRDFINGICSQTIILNDTLNCPTLPSQPPPALVENATSPFTFINSTEIRQSGFGFILPFLTPLFISVFIVIAIATFIEFYIKAHGMGFTSIILIGLGLLTLFGVMPLGFGILFILAVSLILIYQLSRVFMGTAGGG